MSTEAPVAHDMTRFWRIFTIQHGRVNGTFIVKAGKGRVHNITPEDVTIYGDDAHSWGRVLRSGDLTAFLREDGSIDIPKHMIRERSRYEVEDAMDDLLACLRACVEAFPVSGGSEEVIEKMIGKTLACPVEECAGRVRLVLASNAPGDLLVWQCDSGAAHEWHEDGSPRWGVELAVEIEIVTSGDLS